MEKGEGEGKKKKGWLQRRNCSEEREEERGENTFGLGYCVEKNALPLAARREEQGLKGGGGVVAVTVAVTVATEEEENPEEAKPAGTSPSFSAAVSPFP